MIVSVITISFISLRSTYLKNNKKKLKSFYQTFLKLLNCEQMPCHVLI